MINRIAKVGIILITFSSFSALADSDSCQFLFDNDNYEKAVKVCTIEAEQGHAEPQNILGFMYNKGLGVERDNIKAKEWYQLSAVQGNAEAQFNLGYFYAKGWEGEINHTEAKKWFKLSCDNGIQRGCTAYKYLMGL